MLFRVTSIVDDHSRFGAAVVRLQRLAVEESAPGDSLPSEGDLAELLGVSRLTVREALKVLSGRGIVELGRGRRAMVRDRDSSVLAGYLEVAVRRDPRGLLELNEIRVSLEVLSATLAAQHASRAAIAAVNATLADMDEAASIVDASAGRDADALERYHKADVAFHEALALAGGNRMLAFLLESMGESLHHSFTASARGHFARGGTSGEVVTAHRLIAEAVAARDAKAAAAAMRAHLRDTERDLKVALNNSAATAD